MNPSDYTDYAAYGESFALLLDGKLDAQRGRELEKRLSADPELRRFYYEYVKVHTMLRRELVSQGHDGQSPDPSQTLGVILNQSGGRQEGTPATHPVDTPAPIGSVSGATSHSHRHAHRQTSDTYRILRPFSIAALAALFILTVYGLWSYVSNEASPTFARVTGSHNAYWETGGDDNQARPSELSAGQLFLRAGQLELTFNDGTVATLDAPSQVNLISDTHVRLARGSVYVIAPPGVTGFQVSTPGAMAIDLGTEFGVTYTHDFVTEVHVFKGAVSLAPSRHSLSDKSEPDEHKVELREGDYGRVKHDATLESGLKADASRFIRDLDSLTGSNATGGATRASWVAYRDRLRSDPSLVACYDFTRQDNAPGSLRNIALTTGNRLSGVLGHDMAPETSPRWVRGRFSGGHALLFNPDLKQFVELPNDNGELDIPGDMAAVWWMNPIHTFNRDYAMVVLGNGSPRDDYQAEREEDNHFYAHGLKMGKLRAFHESDKGVNQEVLSSTMIQPGRWTHVAVVRDTQAMAYRLYIDGKLSDTIYYKANVTGGGSSRSMVTIGRSGGALLNHFDGRIDEMMIYSRSLSGEEIAELYQRSRPARQ